MSSIWLKTEIFRCKQLSESKKDKYKENHTYAYHSQSARKSKLRSKSSLKVTKEE